MPLKKYGVPVPTAGAFENNPTHAKKAVPKNCDLAYGALDRIRTGDPHLTMVVLYLLSYKGNYLTGGERWIRTIVDSVNGFTVRPL